MNAYCGMAVLPDLPKCSYAPSSGALFCVACSILRKPIMFSGLVIPAGSECCPHSPSPVRQVVNHSAALNMTHAGPCGAAAAVEGLQEVTRYGCSSFFTFPRSACCLLARLKGPPLLVHLLAWVDVI